MSRILVTGGAGFVGGHCILALLAAGHEVRTTLRDPGRAPALRRMLAAGGGDGAGVAVYPANLLADDGWAAAMAGCDAVLHVASPFPAVQPRDEAELLRPAVDGTLRVLRAARGAGIRRVVLTSSFAAIGYGHGDPGRVFTEADWTDPAAPDATPYIRSKTLAERAAWDFVAREGGGLELAAVNPVAILGPALSADLASSVELVRALLRGLPAVPRISLGFVDVRDVADLHLRALTAPAAAGRRFLATAGTLSLRDLALILRAALGPAARRVPTRTLPDALVRLAARFSGRARAAAPLLGRVREGRSDLARDLLGWTPRPLTETIAATGESLVRLGLAGR